MIWKTKVLRKILVICKVSDTLTMLSLAIMSLLIILLYNGINNYKLYINDEKLEQVGKGR